MKKRRYLYSYEADFLGLDVKENKKNRHQGRYMISDDDYAKVLEEFRENKVQAKSDTKPNDYNKKAFVLSAWDVKTGRMMNINDYCIHYTLPREDISSYKLVSHTGNPFYNIVFKEKIEDSSIDFEAIRLILNKELKKTYKYTKTKHTEQVQGVLKWSDLHFGAHINNLINTPDYDSSILENMLNYSVVKLNKQGYIKSHVHINGDLIESFSGLNHINSWMSLNKNEIGSNAIMLCCEMLDRVLKNINNLGCIKIVAGNHDRLSKANDEDVKGGAAELIAWGLKLKGYDVEFNPMIITHLVDGINHLNLHGHLGISKRSTTDIILNYGIQGVFNLICEGHLHSLIEKLSIKQRENFKIVSDDSLNYRRMHLHSFFTGNYYSESLGFLTNAGFSIFCDNGKGKPEHLDVPV